MYREGEEKIWKRDIQLVGAGPTAAPTLFDR